MRIAISGICGFVGSTLARALVESGRHRVVGIDNFIRPGSETNVKALRALGVKVHRGDLRKAADLKPLGRCDWIIDAAANPSVLAGVDGRTSSQELVEHNLYGTVNQLEYCKRTGAGFILLSTSRVYSIAALAEIKLRINEFAYQPSGVRRLASGVDEAFSTAAPISLYGATKLASEALALEYGAAFDIPVYINRCGVLAGAGQFGRPDQGIFTFWLNSHLRRQPLKYLGFGGKGYQTRDCLHPRDLLPLLAKQFAAPKTPISDRIVNLSGGIRSATSLKQLTDWCDAEFGRHRVESDPRTRQFDVPWVVLDHSKATRIWGWKPRTPVSAILEEIAVHARANPNWLKISAPHA